MLNLAVAAILANHLSELAIAKWGAAQSPPILHALGFVRAVTPHQTQGLCVLREGETEQGEQVVGATGVVA